MTTTTATARFVTTHSVLTLDARHPYTAKSLIDAQEMHRTVMSGFRGWVEDGDHAPRAQMGVLSVWSLDLKSATLVLVVQSNVPADWARIPRDALTTTPQTLTVDRTFTAGDTVGFRTVVNPTRSRPTTKPPADKTRGKRTPHTTPHHAKQWFLQRLQAPGESNTGPTGITRIGATTDTEAINVRMLPTLTSSTAHKGLRIARAEIKGRLTVTDPVAFVAALANGFGHGRAYGCGLILTRS